jgi:hypothetical protein
MMVHRPFPSSRRSLLRAPAPRRAAPGAGLVPTARPGGASAAAGPDGARRGDVRPATDAAAS